MFVVHELCCFLRVESWHFYQGRCFEDFRKKSAPARPQYVAVVKFKVYRLKYSFLEDWFSYL